MKKSDGTIGAFFFYHDKLFKFKRLQLKLQKFIFFFVLQIELSHRYKPFALIIHAHEFAKTFRRIDEGGNKGDYDVQSLKRSIKIIHNVLGYLDLYIIETQ